MQDWPKPSDLKGLRGFFRLTEYYRQFVKNYGKIAWPLTQLLKKDSFKWVEKAQIAFEELKEAMTTLPMLAPPSFQKIFIKENDTSDKGVEFVLMQEGRPVACVRKKILERAQDKSVCERELMAIVLTVQRWRHYLWGNIL
ncbi:uncharacterized mitochondrial protein AtMg00860-like [Arachis hypogaea]|uniref:uncharacterized mitochondrial protein AtMg00860-like n=1 Tax=Arachis hypogaea TaxID=3818 RepID=UPI003B20ED3E